MTRTSGHPYIETIKRYYQGCNTADVDLMISTFTDDVVHYFVDHSAVRGAAALANYWAKVGPKTQANWQLDHALSVLRKHRPSETPVALARNMTRPDERVIVTTLADVDPNDVDMFTLVLVGNSQSYLIGNGMATPRGYVDEGADTHATP